MSLNRFEQSLFDYWERQPDERRHWQEKIKAAAARPGFAADGARALERELWEYFVERCQHVPALRDLQVGRSPRISFLNLAELMYRLWGPPPKPKRPPTASGGH